MTRRPMAVRWRARRHPAALGACARLLAGGYLAMETTRALLTLALAIGG